MIDSNKTVENVWLFDEFKSRGLLELRVDFSDNSHYAVEIKYPFGAQELSNSLILLFKIISKSNVVSQ